MDVVRHEAPGQQAITLSIEMQKCLLHERGNGGGPEPALSQSRIEFAIKKMNGFALHSQRFDDLVRLVRERVVEPGAEFALLLIHV